MRRFLRKSTVEREPLAVTMTGVRMGERLLQIGLAEPKLAALLAAKPGLSGQAAIVVADESTAARARTTAGESGILMDVHVAPLHALPVDTGVFDVVILHDAATVLGALDPSMRARAAGEIYRVLRPGGRLISLEPGTPVGLRAMLRRGAPPDAAYEAAGGTARVLESAGFKPVRLLADREGYRYFEGLKA